MMDREGTPAENIACCRKQKKVHGRGKKTEWERQKEAAETQNK